MTIFQALMFGLEKLQKAKINSASLDAEILLSSALKKTKEFIYAHPENEISKIQETRYKKLISKRVKGEPVAYITGHKEFYGLKFFVNKNVLIPRPETELMVDEVISEYKASNCQDILFIDVGTGSGCILIAILKKLSTNLSSRCKSGSRKIEMHGIDISKKALQVARQNAKLHNLSNKIKFIKSSLLSFYHKIDSLLLGKLGVRNDKQIVITANLPYLSEKIYQKNYQNLKYESRNALLAGKDGLKHYRKLLKQIHSLVTHYTLPITLFLEISPEQKNKIKKIIKKNLPKAEIKFKKDLAGLNRLVVIKLNQKCFLSIEKGGEKNADSKNVARASSGRNSIFTLPAVIQEKKVSNAARNYNLAGVTSFKKTADEGKNNS